MEWARSQTGHRSSLHTPNSGKRAVLGKRPGRTDSVPASTTTPESLSEKNAFNYLTTLPSEVVDGDAIFFPDDNEYEFSVPIVSAQGFADSFIECPTSNDVASFQSELSEDADTVAGAPHLYQLDNPKYSFETGLPLSVTYWNPIQDGGMRLSSSKRRRISSDGTDSQSECFSNISIDQSLMSTFNNQAISANLLRIYHDVLEHNLSCWLTEINCPLAIQPPKRDTENNMGLVREWGSTWSNRIYSRAIQLDREGISANLIRLTREEDHAATKALHLAIMAFATQWAQGSHRQREKYPTTFASANDQSPYSLADGLAEEFDRSLQHQIWAQAKRALQDVDELESYRVALAELIFGLTQKAWANEDDDVDAADIRIDSRGSDLKTNVLSRLNEIISKEGPPVYMERAARKVQTLQARYNAARRGIVPLFRNHHKPAMAAANSQFFLSHENRKTTELLYWFAVMFDTVSSSMNERPVVVPDEDISHDADEELYDPMSNRPDGVPINERWDVRAFIQDDMENPVYLPTWPCPYEDAAKAVTKSAPVKVLLFRHLSYLQAILRKGARGKRVEDIISSTISLYRYWNKTYGSFFREMMLDIYSVPARLRSWFFCISCHWNLAALMVADLIAFVDDNNLGVGAETCTRITGKTAWRIRDAGVRELSELAGIAIPCNGMQDASNFHHAVNEGTILTEPWTMILIRAFSMASAILLGEADDSLRHGAAELGYSGGHFEETLAAASNCIKALWHLGKKSDMARKAADFLSLITERLRNYKIGVDG